MRRGKYRSPAHSTHVNKDGHMAKYQKRLLDATAQTDDRRFSVMPYFLRNR